ncbi:MAG: glycosyltransferase family protein [bacterium]|nr:glycosyltransferase family protein [bacterium]
MKIGAIIQARVGSTRFPNKVLLPLPYNSNISVLEQIIKRIKKSKIIKEVVIATTNKKADNIIESLSNKLGIKCFRGNESDVLSRFFYAAKENNLDIIVRLTGDNPCIDYTLIDLILKLHIKGNNDYTETKFYPVGTNVEVLSFKAIEKAFIEASTPFEREHVTPYIHSNPNKFKVVIKDAPKKYYYPDIRITLDTEEDYALLCAVYDYLYPKNEYFNAYDIVNLFKKKPWLKRINEKIVQKKICYSLKEEIKEAVKVLELQDLKKASTLLRKYLEK